MKQFSKAKQLWKVCGLPRLAVSTPTHDDRCVAVNASTHGCTLLARLQCTGSSILAGVIAAFISIGIGSNLVLLILQVVLGRSLTLSSEGWGGILMFSILFGAIGSMLYILSASYIPGSRSARGGYFGLMMFVLLMPLVPESIHEQALEMGDQLPVAVAFFGLLSMGFGVLLEVFSRWLLKNKNPLRTILRS